MGSYDYGKDLIAKWAKENFPKGSAALDVGACDGKWARLLSDHFVMDACEVFAPNAEKLKGKYREVYDCDIDGLLYSYYDLIIFGDVIEHMSVEKAQRVIEYAKKRCVDMLIAVPYLYRQGPIYGNPYEEHIQDDLTPRIFKERYPGMELIWGNSEYAYYHLQRQQP